MAQTKPNTQGKGWMSIALTGVALTTGGAIAAIKNPEGVDLLVTRCILRVGTPSTGAANLSAGFADDDETAATDLINALAVNGSISGKWYNGPAAVTSAKGEITTKWASGKYLTVSGSATTVGLVGTLYVEYLRA